jgi:hypothetical protein
MNGAPRAVTLLLRGAPTPRALELTLDSVLGQTVADFTLLAARDAVGAEGAALMARYGDPRFVVTEADAIDAAVFNGFAFAEIPPGAVLLPTWLAHLAAALSAAPTASVAVCGSTLFDGTSLRPGPVLPCDASARAQAIGRDPLLAAGALWRAAYLHQAHADPAATAALVAGVAARGDAITHPARLLILRTPGPPPPGQRRLPTQICGRTYLPADIEAERPPTLHVVVDTEAEFDWDAPFTPDLSSVGALRALPSAQDIFDRYGLRPVYLIDYPVASQPDGVTAIRAIADRGAAAIGAHLHPWTTPPLDMAIDRHLSFPGNLPEAAEAAKLDALLAIITRNFGAPPVFYKAGRYGLGRNTARLIAARGAKIDFSLLPETDLRHVHGPDFRMVNTIPYQVAGLDLLSVPMTRADVGPLSRWWRLRGWLDTQTAALLHVRAFLARAGLLERLTLTPEGVDARLQIVLLQTLLRRGHRLFVLHFHSPSLAAGNTPYVRTEAERTAFLARIDAVCRWFFEELGGVPGRPWDLLPVEERSRVIF